jgi:hypothetical protein
VVVSAVPPVVELVVPVVVAPAVVAPSSLPLEQPATMAAAIALTMNSPMIFFIGFPPG